MLLKSSSTPLLGSLLPPDHHHHDAAATGKHLPFHSNNNNTVCFSTTASLHSSPSFSDHHRAPTGFRRTNSEGNLNNTFSHAFDSIDVFVCEDSFNFKPNKISRRHTRSILQTIPSFSFYGSRATAEEDDEDELGNFGIENRMEAAIVTPEVTTMEEAWIRVGGSTSGDGIGFVGEDKEMYLATGLGIGGSGGGGDGGRRRSGGGGGGEQNGMEEYYRKMVVENPGNALVLSNYADFLYQWKGDLQGAEEYYSRAILIDSGDGELLSKYAKLVWELHHDQLRASSYFQRALQASPHHSHVQADYANFLWETEEDDDDEEHSLVKEMASQTYTAAATA